MTGDPSLFDNITTLDDDWRIKIADDSTSKVGGVGTMAISEKIILESILLVPALKYKLLSLCKLSKDKCCRINFFADYCEFQDLKSGKTIGRAKSESGLYLLKISSNDIKRTTRDVRLGHHSRKINENIISLWRCSYF